MATSSVSRNFASHRLPVHRCLSSSDNKDSKTFSDLPDEYYEEQPLQSAKERQVPAALRPVLAYDKKYIPRSPDILLESICKSTSIQGLNELINIHGKSMREAHVSHTLRMLSKIAYRESKISEVVSSREFGLLCSRAMRVMRGFECGQALSILMSLLDLKIPLNVLIFQSLLQLIRTKINEFTIKQITFLNWTIDKKFQNQAKDPLVTAIKISLPMVVDLKVSHKEFLDDTSHNLIHALAFAVFADCSAKTITTLIESLNACNDPISEEDYTSLITALAHPNMSKKSKDMDMNVAEGMIIDALNFVTKTASDDKFLEVYRKAFKSKKTFYSKPFFERMCDMFVRDIDKPTLKELAVFVQGLNKLAHVNSKLLDCLEKRILNSKYEIAHDPECDIMMFLTHFIQGASIWSPSRGWNAILDIIVTQERVEHMIQRHPESYYALLEKLAMIGHYRFSVFKHLFETLKVHNHFQIDNKNLLAFNSGLCHDPAVDADDLGEENRHLIRQQLYPFVEAAIQHQNRYRLSELEDSSTASGLKNSLIRGLGGEDFVRSGVWTRSGIFIDHVIVMRRGNYPVAIGKEVKNQLCFLDDLNIPDDSRILAVIGLPQYTFLRHPEIPRPFIDFKARMLRAQGIVVLPVNLSSFQNLLPKEQIPFIMREATQVME